MLSKPTVLLLSTLGLLFTYQGTIYGQDVVLDPEIIQENEGCLKCHGHTYFFYYNDWVERDIKERMNPYFIVDSALFYESNHNTFRCTDCHSYDYTEFPHPNELRMEPMYECADCHEGDDHYAQYHFEEINEEFHKSVHSAKHIEEFTCWMCHNPHTYKINVRSDLKITDIITYDNEICLSCHSHIDKYQLLTTKTNPSVINTHDWLPNQKAHFQHVRCIECHAEINDSILVSHNIQPKEMAVKLCVECHTRDSRLMSTLYKYQSMERRNEVGFVNAVILSESYVIGANRNYYLNLFSLIIFGMVLGGIFTHALLRKLTRKKN